MGDLKRNELIEVIRAKVSAPADIEPKVYDYVIDETLVEYSRHDPQLKVVSVNGTGVFSYDLPTDWVDDFSSIYQLEYPYDASAQSPNVIDPATDYVIYRDLTELQLRFLSHTPSTGETFRVTYSVPHEVTTATSTVPKTSERAVVNYAASLLCEIIATEFEKKTRSTMPDVTLDLRSKAQEWQTQADRYRKLWMHQMGMNADGTVKAASVWMDTDWYLSDGELPLTHPIQ